MNKEELDLLEIVFTLALGECAYNDINNIQKLEDKIKTIGNLYKKQKEVINKAIKLIKYNEKYRDGADCCQFVDIVSEILDPLQSILEKDETTNNAYLKEFEDWLKEVSE